MFWHSSHSRKASPRSLARQSTGGFGLVELMVSISIMAIVAAVVLTRQSTFNSAVLLRSEAYQIALQVREVQLNAVSASGDTGTFRDVLGVHFSTTTDGTYRIFRDANTNGFYDGATEEFGLQGILDSRFEIRDIRGVGATISGNEVSVIFVRPNFDARFFHSAGSELTASAVEIDVARRGVTGNGPEVVRTLEITSTGQIAVQ